MSAGVLNAGHDLGGDDVTRDADDEEFTKVGIEDEFGRNARVAAAEDGGVGALFLGESGERFLADGGEARFTGNEALVAIDEPAESLRRCKHGAQSPGTGGVFDG